MSDALAAALPQGQKGILPMRGITQPAISTCSKDTLAPLTSSARTLSSTSRRVDPSGRRQYIRAMGGAGRSAQVARPPPASTDYGRVVAGRSILCTVVLTVIA